MHPQCPKEPGSLLALQNFFYSLCHNSGLPLSFHFFFPLLWQEQNNTEPQNCKGWNGHLELIQSNYPCCRGFPTVNHMGRHPGGVLCISREGDSTAYLGNLFHCSFTFQVKKSFLIFVWNFLSSSMCPLLLVLLLHTTKNTRLHPLDSCPVDIYKHW